MPNSFGSSSFDQDFASGTVSGSPTAPNRKACVAVLFALSISGGTGTVAGVVAPDLLASVSTYSAPRAPVTSLPKKLELIRNCFSLTISGLAKVLRVERPSVYKWMQSDNLNLRADNRDRVEQIYALAEIWSAKNDRPMESLAQIPLSTGQSFIALLSEEVIDEKVQEYLDSISDYAHGITSGPFKTSPMIKLRNELKSRGLIDPDHENQNQNLEDHDQLSDSV